MIIRLPNSGVSITDEWTGVVTSGGSIALVDDTPFYVGGGAYGKLSVVNPTFVYAYRNLAPAESAAIAAQRYGSVRFHLRVLQFPAGPFDVAMLRRQGNNAAVIWLRFIQDGANWMLRLYARQDDSAVLGVNTTPRPPAYWADPHTVTMEFRILGPELLGSSVVAVYPIGSEDADDLSSLADLDNDTQLSSLGRLDLGSSSTPSATTVFEWDDVIVQDSQWLGSSPPLPPPPLVRHGLPPSDLVTLNRPWGWGW